MRIVKVLIALILIVFIFRGDCQAVTVSVTSAPSTISDQPFIITASVSGANAGTNYLRVALYKDGTNNYFGETYNGSDWYTGGDGALYFPVTIDSSRIGTATFQGKIGSPNSNDYPGAGSYKLKVRRYTSSGSEASNDTQTPVDVNINFSSPTPTSAPSSTPTPSVTPAPTLTPTNTPIPTKIPTPKPTKTPTPTKSSEIASTTAVLGQKTLGLTSEEDKNSSNQESFELPENFLPIIFVILGIIFLVLCGGIIAYPYIKKFKEEKFPK